MGIWIENNPGKPIEMRDQFPRTSKKRGSPKASTDTEAAPKRQKNAKKYATYHGLPATQMVADADQAKLEAEKAETQKAEDAMWAETYKGEVEGVKNFNGRLAEEKKAQLAEEKEKKKQARLARL